MAGVPEGRSNERWMHELRAQGASAAAVTDLRRYLHRGLHKQLASRGVGEADVEDFVQESVVRVLASLTTFRGESRFTTWATAIAVRVAFGALRRRRYRESHEETAPEALEIAASTIAGDSDPARQLDRGGLLDALRRAIANELTEHQRSAVLGELAGVPTEVLAERMGITRNAAYKLHHDARKKLRAAILKAGFTDADVRRELHDATEG